jgi:hypothetical protein
MVSITIPTIPRIVSIYSERQLLAEYNNGRWFNYTVISPPTAYISICFNLSKDPVYFANLATGEEMVNKLEKIHLTFLKTSLQ